MQLILIMLLFNEYFYSVCMCLLHNTSECSAVSSEWHKSHMDLYCFMQWLFSFSSREQINPPSLFFFCPLLANSSGSPRKPQSLKVFGQSTYHPGDSMMGRTQISYFLNYLSCCSQKHQQNPHDFCANCLMLCSGCWSPSSNARLGKGIRFGMRQQRLGEVFLEAGVLIAPSTSVLLGVHFLLWLTQPLHPPRWDVHCLAGSQDICSTQWGFGAVEAKSCGAYVCKRHPWELRLNFWRLPCAHVVRPWAWGSGEKGELWAAQCELPSTRVCKIRDLVVEAWLWDWLLLPLAKTFQSCAKLTKPHRTNLCSRNRERSAAELQPVPLAVPVLAVNENGSALVTLAHSSFVARWGWQTLRSTSAYEDSNGKCWSWLSSAAQEHSHFLTSSSTCQDSVWVPDYLPWLLWATGNRRYLL